jgi:N-acetylglucosamine-6-sulfatase
LSILACVTVFFAVGCAESESLQERGAEATVSRPNIVFVLTDDLDYAPAQKMPEIGSLLVGGGASFEEAFASQSLCCPSRAGRPSSSTSTSIPAPYRIISPRRRLREVP